MTTPPPPRDPAVASAAAEASSAATAATGTRARLVHAMADALQRRGLHGVGLNELLSVSGAPKGVLYHHFPGGKTELAVEAIKATVARLIRALSASAHGRPDLVRSLGEWWATAQATLASSQFERGCPLATVALESTAGDVALRAALNDGFTAIRRELADALQSAGVATERAAALATLFVAAFEGALMQARVAGSAQPMADAVGPLLDLLRHEIPSPGPSLASANANANANASAGAGAGAAPATPAS